MIKSLRKERILYGKCDKAPGQKVKQYIYQLSEYIQLKPAQATKTHKAHSFNHRLGASLILYVFLGLAMATTNEKNEFSENFTILVGIFESSTRMILYPSTKVHSNSMLVEGVRLIESFYHGFSLKPLERLDRDFQGGFISDNQNFIYVYRYRISLNYI